MKCKSLKEYINIIEKSQIILDSTMVWKLYYRGHSDKRYKLIPSLCHVLEGCDTETYINFEKQIIENAQMRYPELFGNYKNKVDLLSKIQHYGLPHG